MKKKVKKDIRRIDKSDSRKVRGLKKQLAVWEKKWSEMDAKYHRHYDSICDVESQIEDLDNKRFYLERKQLKLEEEHSKMEDRMCDAEDMIDGIERRIVQSQLK